MLYAQERLLALQAGQRAAQLCEAVRREQGATAFAKPDRSPVTLADYGSQALICQAILEVFPQDPIMAEEDARMLQQSEQAAVLGDLTAYVQRWLPQATPDRVLAWIAHGKTGMGQRFWTIDPIDGTKGYVRGDQYAIALALVEQGQVQVGVIVAPALPPYAGHAVQETQKSQEKTAERGVAFVAVRGQGTEQISLTTGAAQAIHVNPPGDFASFRLIESVEQRHGTPELQRTIAKSLGITAPPMAMDSLAKYGAIARGEADLYLRLCSATSTVQIENIWDHGAGVLVLEEAGGVVTDQQGKPLDFRGGFQLVNNRGIIASNGTLQAAAIAKVRELCS